MAGETDQARWRGVQPVEGISGVWPARDAVRVHAAAGLVGLGVIIVYTVPSGKKLFLPFASLHGHLANAATTATRLGVRDSVDAFRYWIFYGYLRIVTQINVFSAFTPALEVEEDEDVYVENLSAELTGRGIIHGWLEDA